MTTPKPTKPHILILSFSPLAKDPRVLRQAAFLHGALRVSAAGYGAPPAHCNDFIPIAPPGTNALFKALQAARLKLNRFEAYYWAQPHVRDAWEKLQGVSCDLVLANDLASLPLAACLADKHGAGLLLDAHEYEPRHFEGDPVFDFFFRPLWDHVARRHLGAVDAMTTVCDGIAGLYSREYGIRPTVITNAPFHDAAPPSPVRADAIRMIHHGICTKFRGIEAMVELVSRLDERFSLDLMLVAVDPAYFSRVQGLVDEAPRVSLRPAVPFDSIVTTLNGYDIGLCMLPPRTPTLEYALPNKFFEFIQAKLCVCSWPSREITKIIRETGCGRVSDEFEVASMAQVILGMDEGDIARHKEKATQGARTYCAERNREILMDIVTGVLNR